MWETLVAVCHCFRVSIKQKSTETEFELMMWQSDLSRHNNKKKKKKKEGKKKTWVVTIVRLQKNGGELLPNKELGKGFLERCEIPCGVICGFSKEQTYCIPPGINWPERDREDNTVRVEKMKEIQLDTIAVSSSIKRLHVVILQIQKLYIYWPQTANVYMHLFMNSFFWCNVAEDTQKKSYSGSKEELTMSWPLCIYFVFNFPLSKDATAHLHTSLFLKIQLIDVPHWLFCSVWVGSLTMAPTP